MSLFLAMIATYLLGSNVMRILYPLFGYEGLNDWQFKWGALQDGATLSEVLVFLPACFGRLWLLLYLISGLILKLSRRLDVGFNWFNNKFDIEHRPLQCVGLIAGTIVALSYWIVAAITIATNIPAKGV